MALTEYTLDETSIGSVLTPENGYLVTLVRTKPQVYDGPPRWSEAKRRFVSGYCVLKGAGDVQNLISIDPSNPIAVGGVWVQNRSLNYSGLLEVVCIPKGSQWALTLSSTPYVRAAEIWPTSLIDRVERLRERELVRR